MIAVVDYGAGNLFSVAKALEKTGARVRVTSDASVIKAADKLVLPGVGSFGGCMNSLTASGLAGPVKEFARSGKPFLGICVGMQMLFEESEESPGVAGLGLLQGTVRRLAGAGLKIPHTGWNSLHGVRAGGVLPEGFEGEYVYFVHSYYACPAEGNMVSAVVDYGGDITAAVMYNNINAVQFHPEKSGAAGLKILQLFGEL